MYKKIFFVLLLFIISCSSEIHQVELNENETINNLILNLTSEDYDTRFKASTNLAEIGKEAAPYVISFLEKQPYYNVDSSGFRARWESVNVLGKVKDERAVDSLVRRVLDDEESHVRWRSLWALSSIDSNKTVRLLFDNLGSEDQFVRWNAAVGLGYFGNKKSIPVLLEGLKSEDDWIKWEAVYVLGILKDSSTTSNLIKMLDDNSVRIRQETCLTLGKIGDEKAVPYLVKALDDESSEVRWRAASALADLKAEESVNKIEEILEKETNEIAKENLQKSLEKLKNS